MWKLGLVFALIVLLLSRRWNLGIVLLVASALIGLLYGLPPLDILREAGIAAIDVTTLRLLAAVLLISALGELLSEIRSLERMVNALQGLLRDPRLVMAVVPALIGLLPMPGGAMLSAPMIQEIGTQQELSAERKTFLNYWFRHVWEYVFPLYPALILAAGLMNLRLPTLLLRQSPFTLAAIAGGTVVGLRTIRGHNPTTHNLEEHGQRYHLRELAISIWPIVLVIALSLGFGLELALGLVAAIALTTIVHRVPCRSLLDVLKRGFLPRLVILVLGIMIFKQMIEASGAADGLSSSFASLGLPPAVTVVAVAGATGLLTGLAMSMVGIAIPLLLPIIGSDGTQISLAILAYVAGFIGILLSPMHLCLALTREYFGAKWLKLYGMLVPAAGILTATAAILWFVY